MARETAFHPITARTAAGFGEEAGWLWVTNFGDVDAEYRAIREGVGMWDLSPLNKWEFRGPEAREAAQRVHTHDIMAAERGQVRYGAFVDEDGMVVGDGTVFVLADTPGTKVEAVTARGPIPGTVDILAIYDPGKKRPRA